MIILPDTGGAPGIHGELMKLGFDVCERSVSRYLAKIKPEPSGNKINKWMTFITNQGKGIAERWVGSCRRELLDYVIILNQNHLYRLLEEYIEYYHQDRTHYHLDKDPPISRPIQKKGSDYDKVIALPRVGGLHHKYVWKEAA